MRRRQCKKCMQTNSNSWPPTSITPPAYSIPLLLSYLYLLPSFFPPHNLNSPSHFSVRLSFLTPLSLPPVPYFTVIQLAAIRQCHDSAVSTQRSAVLRTAKYRLFARSPSLPFAKAKTHTKAFMVMDVKIRTCCIDRCVEAGWKLTGSDRYRVTNYAVSKD